MLKIAALTDVGRVRDSNEDYFFIDPGNHLLIVADGAGGHDHGEIASRLAVESCYQYLTREDYLQDTSNITRTLMDSITFANQQVIDYKKKHLPGSNMGTTLTCAHVGNNEISYAWMGDSRVYLLDVTAGLGTQLSTDHTLYQEMLSQGQSGEAFRYNQHILSRMLGTNPFTRPDGGSSSMVSGQTLLCCTDGFSGLVSPGRMLELLEAAGDDLDHAVGQLVATAKDEGGHDNITVALARL